MKELIKKLSDLRGVSGFEYRLNRQIADMFMPYCDDVKIDTLGNVIAYKASGKPDAPSVMLEAHCDEIGLIVTSITDEGFLTFANVGGVDNRILPSLEVTVHAKKDLWGVIGIRCSHLREDGKTEKIKDLAIDTGLDADEVKELVSIGDSVTLPQSAGSLGKEQWSGKTLDDRASVAALLQVMKNIQNKDLNVDVYAVAAVQEEVGSRGAKTAVFGINPDMAIAVDVTHAITPDNSEDAFEAGCGAVVAKGPNLHPMMTERLLSVAQKNGIKTEIEVEGGDTGTDAWELQTARNGIPTALISIPLKYMHTAVETLVIDDVKRASRLMEQFILESEGDTKWLCS